MSANLRVAVVGAGYFARFHLDSWLRMDGVELVGVADRDPAALAQWDVPGFTGLEPMLESLRPDVLDIALPPAFHRDAIEAALGAGVRAIICQKPFCGGLEGAGAAVALARSAGVRLIVHENFRFQPWYRAAGEAIRAGRLGAVRQMTFRLRTGDGQGPRAYLDRQPYFREMPRFLIHETGVHYIDVFRALLGPVRRVYADLRRLNSDIAGEDAGHFLLEHDSGARSLFDGNRLLDHAAQNHRLTLGEALIEGDAGMLTLGGDGGLWFRAFGAVESECVLFPQAWPGFGGDCVHAFQCHARDAILSGEAAETEAADYLAVLRIEEALYAAAAEGRKLPVQA